MYKRVVRISLLLICLKMLSRQVIFIIIIGLTFEFVHGKTHTQCEWSDCKTGDCAPGTAHLSTEKCDTFYTRSQCCIKGKHTCAHSGCKYDCPEGTLTLSTAKCDTFYKQHKCCLEGKRICNWSDCKLTVLPVQNSWLNANVIHFIHKIIAVFNRHLIQIK